MTKKENTKKTKMNNIAYLVLDIQADSGEKMLKYFENKNKVCEWLYNKIYDYKHQYIQSYIDDNFIFYTLKNDILLKIDPPNIKTSSITFEFSE